MQNKKRVMQTIIATAQYFEKALPETVIEIYLKALMPFNDAAICDAFNQSIIEMKFFPKVADIIERIKGPNPTVKDNTAVAWSKLVRAIEQQGQWKSVVFQDAAIMSVVRAMGGWERVCEWQLEDLNWRQKEFFELYGGLQHTKAPAYLPGFAERKNITGGFKPEQPVLADGDSHKVLPMPQKTDCEILKQISDRAGAGL